MTTSIEPLRLREVRFRRLSLAVIFLMALVVRVVSYTDMKDSPLFNDEIPLADSNYYDQRAKRIAGGELGGNDVFFLSPLYEYVLAIPYFLR